MEEALTSYKRREQALRRKHERMARGYVTKLDKKTGNYVQVPVGQSGGMGLRLMLLAAAAFIAFKTLVLTFIGVGAYQAHVDTLAGGSTFEQVGAWLMQIDPLTAKLAEFGSLLVS
ncbi:hypothetical protein [Sagittula stellata]|uniref:Uncharacterized protein n=1 Tax=Sagittula stellata (strain ATCC 700073 / DSM 11524 / E-37) TaxID=388399 RepID=A3K9B3_SAGS3|nr:hypothetical protein [Sagittula stellata]EBA06285.1 hypothetical protein SSE37_15421 [Sagittula stellata E-37]